MILPQLTEEESPRFKACAAGFGCVASAALVARTAGDALFLSAYPAEWLCYMYMATAVVITGVAFLFGIWSSRVPIDRLVVRSGLVLIVALVGLRAGFAFDLPGLRIAAYVMGDVVVVVPMLLFWSLAAMVFNPREAKRLFGVVGAAGTAGCIVVGFVVKPAATAFGTPNLLLLAAALLAGFVAAAARLGARYPGQFQAGGPRTGASPVSLGYYGSLLKSHQVRNLIFLVVAATITLTTVDYQFKAACRAQFNGPDLAGFFGSFYAVASVVALVLQLFLVGPILQRGGVLAGLVILPASLAIAAVGTALTGAFEWMVITRFTVQIFLFTIDIAALQMLYLGIARQSRSQARTFVEGMGKPLAMAAAGAVIIGSIAALADVLDLRWLSLGVLAGTLLWLLFTRANYRAYVSALVESLGAGRLDFTEEPTGIRDPGFTAHIKSSLDSADDDEIPYLLELLPDMDDVDWTPEYRRLLQRDNPQVKVQCLQALASSGTEEDLPAIADHITHPDARVRAIALQAAGDLGGIGGDSAGDIESALEDSDPRVRAASVAILINSGDLDRLLSAGAVLRDMLRSDAIADRVGAAEALANLTTRGLVRPIIGLLEDEAPEVRLAALEACRKRPNPNLVAAVIPLLADGAVAQAAADTMVSFGQASVDHLIPYLELSRMEGAFGGAHRVPDILARIGHPSALPHLLKATEHMDLQLRAAAVEAFAHLIGLGPSTRTYGDEIERSARREVAAASEHQQALAAVEGGPGAEVLADALAESYDSHLRNAFVLMDLMTQRVNMRALYEGLLSRPGEEAANTLEVLDNVLSGNLKTEIVSLLEQSLKRTAPRSPGSPKDISMLTLRLAQEATSEWVTIGALYAAAENGLSDVGDVAAGQIGHANPFVRETALYTLSRLSTEAARKAARNSAQTLIDDPDEGVRRLANELAA